jgi:hypothetical protein
LRSNRKLKYEYSSNKCKRVGSNLLDQYSDEACMEEKYLDPRGDSLAGFVVENENEAEEEDDDEDAAQKPKTVFNMPADSLEDDASHSTTHWTAMAKNVDETATVHVRKTKPKPVPSYLKEFMDVEAEEARRSGDESSVDGSGDEEC